MPKSLTEISTILDGMADALFQIAGYVAKDEELAKVGVELFDKDGKPVDLRDLAADIRKHVAAGN